MSEDTRTSKSIKNMIFTIINYIMTIILTFIVRTVFIRELGNVYLGINGLFTNVITMLSLAELGIGIALPASLYKPLAEKNEKKIAILMNFYKKVYNTIGIVVLIVGLSLTPFIEHIVKEVPEVQNFKLIYILFVLNSALSYFFVYKKSLIVSDQKSYIVTKINFIFSTILSMIQILILIFTRNYFLYLISNILNTIMQNVYISYKCSKMYPYINKNTNEKMNKNELLAIKKNVSALFLYKIGIVITNGTDNIIISKFIGVITVGLCSNYTLIINTINTFLNQIVDSISASIGNLIVSKNEKRKYEVYLETSFITFWSYGVCCICLWILINPFISLWIGNENFLDSLTVTILIINIYILGMQNANSSFRNAFELFWKGKFRPVLMVIVNLFVSIILVKKIGIAGVFIGTFVSRLTTTAWIDPYIVHKYGFKKSMKPYVVKYLNYATSVVVVAIITKFITSSIPDNNYLFLIIKAIVVFGIINVLFILIYFRTNEFKCVKNMIINIFKNKVSKR